MHFTSAINARQTISEKLIFGKIGTKLRHTLIKERDDSLQLNNLLLGAAKNREVHVTLRLADFLP